MVLINYYYYSEHKTELEHYQQNNYYDNSYLFIVNCYVSQQTTALSSFFLSIILARAFWLRSESIRNIHLICVHSVYWEINNCFTNWAHQKQKGRHLPWRRTSVSSSIRSLLLLSIWLLYHHKITAMNKHLWIVITQYRYMAEKKRGLSIHGTFSSLCHIDMAWAI